jgi:hypothetical protein
MTNQEIHQALDTAVAAITGLPPTTTENVTGKPVANAPFTRTTMIPARPNRLTVGVTGKDELIGLFQVDLYYPVGSGVTASLTAAESVVTAFPRTWQTTVSGDVLRVTSSWIEGGRTINSWYAVAVMLSYSSIR